MIAAANQSLITFTNESHIAKSTEQRALLSESYSLKGKQALFIPLTYVSLHLVLTNNYKEKTSKPNQTDNADRRIIGN